MVDLRAALRTDASPSAPPQLSGAALGSPLSRDRAFARPTLGRAHRSEAGLPPENRHPHWSLPACPQFELLARLWRTGHLTGFCPVHTLVPLNFASCSIWRPKATCLFLP